MSNSNGKCSTSVMASGVGKFTVQLNGQMLNEQLDSFQKLCREHKLHYRQRCKRRYYHLGLVVRLNMQTTDEELHRLLKHGARTFLVDLISHKTLETEKMLLKLREAVNTSQQEPLLNRVVTGLAFEISGDCCRIGRLRNNYPLSMHCKDVITLTTIEDYRYCGVKEIMFVINLKYYLKNINLGDELYIGGGARGRIVKKLHNNMALLIVSGGFIYSYDYIKLPEKCMRVNPKVYRHLFERDVRQCQKLGGNFIVVPNVRTPCFVRELRNFLTTNKIDLRIIGYLDVEHIRQQPIDLTSLFKLLDYLLFPQIFSTDSSLQKYIVDDIIPSARCLQKPIIGLVPLEQCPDFKMFQNHPILYKLDAILIEKSPLCNKYPIIVKKLLPIHTFRYAMVENQQTVKQLTASYPSIVNFIIRTISTIECQAILLHSRCERSALALSRMEIYCPVYVMLPLSEENQMCFERMARTYNLRRNLHAITYTLDMNKCAYEPIDYGIQLLRSADILQTGDFVVTIKLTNENDNDDEADGHDILLLSAFYLPPQKIANKYKNA